mgnify:CR=1 FL=1
MPQIKPMLLTTNMKADMGSLRELDMTQEDKTKVGLEQILRVGLR